MRSGSESNGEFLRFGGIHPPALSEEEWQEAHNAICSFFLPAPA